MEKTEYAGRGHAVQGFKDKEKDFVVYTVLNWESVQVLEGRGEMPPGSCVTYNCHN